MEPRTKDQQPRRVHYVTDVEAATERTPLIQQKQRLKQCHDQDQDQNLDHGCRPLAMNVAAMLTISVALVLLYLVSPRSPLLRQATWPQPADNLTWAVAPASAPVGYKGPRIHFPANHTIHPRLPGLSFPDPSIVRGEDGAWYAFGTNGNGKHIQVARTTTEMADPLGEWELLDHDALPQKAWTSGHNFWAPDVRRVGDGSYVMYFSGHRPQGKHCVGVARSRTVAGPYAPDPEPWACPLDIGGAIDPSGFVDEVTRRRYVVYKVDGNALGHGGSCNNMAEPQTATPIMLQEVDALDGVTKVGPAVAILDRTEEDGPLVEAPNLVRSPRDGRFLLFFSSHCFSNAAYDVKFAWADAVEGPYHRGHGARRSSSSGGHDDDDDDDGEYEVQGSLLRTGDFGLRGPGGMTSTVGRTADGEDEVLLLHGRCGWRRCMYALPYRVL